MGGTTWRPRSRGALSVAALVALATSATPAAAGTRAGARGATGAPLPVVSGPITGGPRGVPFNAMPRDLERRYGYTEHEYFLHGTATAFAPSGTLGTDGRWSVTPTTTAPYVTRMIVRRPSDPRRFSGTVVVEWLNVTAGMDADPDFGFAYPELLAHGDAYVGVSAQAAGVVGGPSIINVPGVTLQALKQWDPVRYAPLVHPGDDYSYDMFSQAGAALRQHQGVDPLGGLKPRHVIATGESQSAFCLVTYVDAIAPIAHVFDGYLIHSRGGSGSPVSAATAGAMPTVATIRTDLAQPVITFETETDVSLLGFDAARQPDTPHLRTWEVAGTAHADTSTLAYGFASAKVWSDQTPPDFTSSCGSINQGPQSAVLHKVWAALTTWVATGTPPAVAPPLQVAGGAIARDQLGNALGGLRTPPVDAPTAALSGSNPSTDLLCSLFGTTTPLSPATLASLYPTHADYVRQVFASAQAAVAEGHLLPADAAAMIRAAQRAKVPR